MIESVRVGPLSASDTAHREKVDCMIRANRRVKQKEIADEVGISKERVHHIATTVLVTQKSLPVGSQDSSL